MFVTPGTLPDLSHRLSRDAAERIARNWPALLVNGLLLIVAGILIFSIDWTTRSLATFLGALFIVEGLFMALRTGLDARVRQTNVLTGLLSIAAGVAIIVWPGPGIVALAIFLGAWLIVVGTLTISGSLAARRVIPDWWLLLITGVLEAALGVLALANPGGTLAALVTVGGIWAVAIGLMYFVTAAQIKHLPKDVDKAFAQATNGTAKAAQPAPDRSAPAPAGS
jgi:uncharacterized membrane protein HdeD (DUF308 family)